MLNTNYLPGTAFALDDAILVEIRTDMNLVFGALSLPRRGRPSGEGRGGVTDLKQTFIQISYVNYERNSPVIIV